MRHDDLNKTEPLPASYNLVEAPAEEQKPAAGTPEAAPPRPEAAVKGITPQQPAPVPVAREARPEPQSHPRSDPATEQPSIIGKLFGWFTRKPVEEASLPEVARPSPTQGPRRGRQDRGEREGPRREREDRPMQQGGQRQRPPQQHGQRDGGRQRGEQQRHEHRRQETPRHEQPQQQRPHPQRDPAQAEARSPSPPQQPAREHAGEQREGRGRRRRRGGRDRYEQRQQEAGGGSGRGQQAERQPGRPEAERPEQHTAPGAGAASLAGSAMAGFAASTGAVDAAPPPSSFETEVVREFEPRASESVAPVPSGPGYAPAEPVRIEWPSDLVQVESDPAKTQTAEQAEIVEQPVQRPKRVRPPVQPLTEEPLEQIETGQAEPASAGVGEKGNETALPG